MSGKNTIDSILNRLNGSNQFSGPVRKEETQVTLLPDVKAQVLPEPIIRSQNQRDTTADDSSSEPERVALFRNDLLSKVSEKRVPDLSTRLRIRAESDAMRAEDLTRERRDILGFNPAPTQDQRDRVSEIDREREALRQQAGQLEEDARWAEYGQLRYRPDFSANSTRPRSALDDVRRRAGGEAVDERYLVGLEHSGYVGSMEWIERARQLTDDELAMYNYLRNTEGQESADAYLDLMEETLNQRVGGKQAEDIANIENPLLRTAATGAYAVGSGLDQFGTGVQQLFTEKALPTTATQFGAAQVREDLADASPSIGGKPLVLPGGTSLGQAAFDLVSSAANMAPGLALSAATAGAGAAPWLSGLAASASLGASSGGNAYNEAVKQGYTPAQARSYAILTGASEGGLQYLLGGIGALGGRVSRNVIQNTVKNIDNALLRAGAELGLNMLSEGAEEYLQEVLTPVFRNIALDENNPVELVSEEAIYAGILGALSAGVLEGPGRVSGAVSDARTDRSIDRAYSGMMESGIAGFTPGTSSKARSTGQYGTSTSDAWYNRNADVQLLPSRETEARAEPVPAQNSTAASTGETAALRGDVRELTLPGGEEIPISQRTWQDASNRKVNAFQYDHPELRPYYQSAARALLSDLSSAVRGERFPTYDQDGYVTGYTGVKRSVSEPIEQALDNANLSYAQIQKAAEDLIADNGQENYAAAKKLELILDQMLSEGYTDAEGRFIEPDEAYIALRDGQPVNGSEYRMSEEEWNSIMSQEPAGLPSTFNASPEPLPVLDQVQAGEGGGPLYGQGPESSVGAARADFSLGPHERKTSRLADTALKNQFRGTDMTPEERAPYLETTRKTERQSVGEAEQELYFNTPDGRSFLGDIDPEGLRDTMRKLKDASAWDGVQVDMAMSIKNDLQRRLNEYEITPEEYMDWIDTMTDHATATGQGTQAWAKYSRALGSLREEKMALDWLKDSRLSDTEKNEAVENMVGWENAVEAVPYGDTDGMIEQIDRLVRERGTRRSVLLGRDRGLSAVQRKLLSGKDFETLKEYARANAVATVTDLRSSDIGQKLRTIQVINHLLRLTTIDKNLTGNTIFGSLDASTNIVGSLIDRAVSAKTGTRSVAVDMAVFRGQAWRDAWDAFIDSALQVSMDINTNRLESRYGNVTNRTFKMSGGLPSRIGSSLEKLLGYALTSTDEFAKGFARSNTEYGLNKLAERGRIQGADVEKFIRDSAEETAKYRTFQSDSVLSGALQTVSDYLNAAIGVGDSGRRTAKGGHKVHSFGLGSFLAPYTKVGGNLPTVAAHYSPAGVASGLKAVAEVMRSKNPSPAQQRAAVTKLSRGLSGTGAWAFAAWLFLSGICHFVSPDEDKDAAAQLESQGLSDIQLNVSALGRALSGQGFTGLQPGDQMQSLSSLEPMNAWLYAGAALASDLQDGGNVFSALLAGMDSTINGVMEAPVLSSFQNIYEDMRYNGGSLAGSVANTVADSISSSLLPGALKDVAAATDNRVRVIYDTEDPVERQVNIIKSGIPGLRQTLPVKEDAYGNEKRYSHNDVVGFLNKLLLPTALDTYEATEVTENLRQLYEETGDGSIYLSKNAPEEFSVDKQLTTLDQAGKDRYMDVRSAAANKALEELMSSSMYQNAGTQERVALVNAANSFAKDQGKAAVVEGFSSPATRAADAGIPFTSYYQYKTMLSEKPEGTTNANWNREVRNAIFSDTVLSAAQKKALDNILINDGRYIPEEKEVEYSDTESFLISQMSDSAQRRWPGIRDRFGLSAEEYQEAVRIYNMDKDDGVTTADKKRMLRELFGQYGNAIYKALGEQIEDDED